MKTFYSLLLFIILQRCMKKLFLCFLQLLFVSFAFTSYCQEKEYVVGQGATQSLSTKPVKRSAPTYSKTVEGFVIKVWVSSENKGVMPNHPDEANVDESMKQATHRVKVVVLNAKTRKPVRNAEVWFHIVYPSKKNLMPKLVSLADYFGGGINLNEKGKYTLMAHVNIGEQHPAVSFSYEVK